jgi:hypothetical protein
MPGPRAVVSAAAALILAWYPALAVAQERGAAPGFAVSGMQGLNVDRPFFGARFARRFERASFFELGVEYSYNARISEFAFHTVGLSTRAYFAEFGRVELFHQALLGVAIAGGGTSPATNRDLGARFLGAFMTQGIGASIWVASGLSLQVSASTGYPVWLRPELALRYRF